MADQRRIGPYQLQGELGVGGMGTVFRGLDTRSSQIIAIKQLKSELAQPEIIERFKREGEALRELNHPNIVKMLDALEHEGQHYLIIEYLPGGDLRQLIESGPLPTRRVMNIALDLADALTRAHRLDIVHRDLKPANVLIADDGTPRLTDFGVAHLGQKGRVTDIGTIVGTADYLPPEAFNESFFDARGDIWAFGVMLFEMLAGYRPFQGSGLIQVIQSIVNDPVPDLEALRPDAPVALVDLIYRALEKDPQARIPSVRQIGLELEAILQGRATSVQGPRFDTPTPVSQPVRHNLPVQTTPFVGREDELNEVTTLVDDPANRLITILGPGGMGKTRLSLEIGARQLERFDGVYFLQLAPLSAPEHIVSALADAVGYTFQPDERSPQQQVLDYIASKHLLLIMDNYEHLLAGAGIVSEILQAAPQVKVVVTSRQRLNQTGETAFNLTGLGFPDWQSTEEALAYPAVQLFLQSARRARADFTLSDEELPDVARICRLVEGLPLGIVLAASWVSMLSPQEIAAEIQSGVDFLESEATDLPERQRSIRAVFDYSWNLLTEAERSGFMRLSVFRGGFTREAAEAVAGANLRMLLALNNKSLIRRDVTSGRYDIHELMRQYSAEQLDRAGMNSSTRQAHAAYFSTWLQQQGDNLRSARQLDAIAHIHQEFENIRLAWLSSIEQGAFDQIMQMQEQLWLYCHIANLFDDAIRFYADAASAIAKLPTDNDSRIKRAILQAKQGLPLHLRGRFEEAQTLVTDAQNVLKEQGLVDGYVEFFLAWTGRQQAERYEMGQQAIERFARHEPDNWYVIHIEMSLAAIALDLERFNDARAHINRAVTLSQQPHRGIWSIAWCYLYSGFVDIVCGDHAHAISQLESAYTHFQRLGDAMGLYYSDIHVANASDALGQYTTAIRHLARALKTTLKYNHIRLSNETLKSLCEALLKHGDQAQAAAVYQASLHDPEMRPVIIDNASDYPEEVTAASLAPGTTPALGTLLAELMHPES